MVSPFESSSPDSQRTAGGAGWLRGSWQPTIASPTGSKPRSRTDVALVVLGCIALAVIAILDLIGLLEVIR